ncbi:hypothetical protein [Haloferax sp. DFSO60]|uniref:hypothetical protein n=1 Tax=Haloferax sp. DFSO60 TaxID=3388652 RepID=UPI00397B2B50
MHDDAFYFEQLGETHLRGQAAEAIVKAAFLRRGIPVLVPEYDNEPYISSSNWTAISFDYRSRRGTTRTRGR